MDARTKEQLRALNQRFYARHALAFADSRDHPWPGWQWIDFPVPDDPARPMRVLDVGCGNGRFAEAVESRIGSGFTYTGVDENAVLLDQAAGRLAGVAATECVLIRADVLAKDPAETLPPERYDLVVAFGLLHHVPGRELRRSLVAALADRVDQAGRLVVTAWQFADRPRFARHIVPWSTCEESVGAPIDTLRLEPGDHLLSFDGDRSTLRYCHHCDERELDELAAAVPFAARPRFSADGRSGDLNRYLVFERGEVPDPTAR